MGTTALVSNVAAETAAVRPPGETANLADGLTALVQRHGMAAKQANCQLYFDYQGANEFEPGEAGCVIRCAELMLAEAMEAVGSGEGSVFLTVQVWSFSLAQRRVLLQIAHTAQRGRQDLTHLSAALDGQDAAAPSQGQASRHAGIEQACALAAGAFRRRETPGMGTALELELTLHKPGEGLDEEASVDLATVSAWLIGPHAQTAAVLSSRLQRDGWLVRSFPDLGDALRFTALRTGVGALPALVVLTDSSEVTRGALSSARKIWGLECRLILGVQEGSAHSGTALQTLDGIEVRKLPFSPADLRGLKEQAFKLEGHRLRQATGQRQEGTKHRVLVVDDDPINRILAEEMLRVLGYDVDLAANGLEAVEYIEQYSPRAVLMDLDMPVMGGMEAARRIRRYEKHEHQRRPVKIVASTARPDEAAYKACREAGISHFVPKPILLTQLASVLAQGVG